MFAHHDCVKSHKHDLQFSDKFYFKLLLSFKTYQFSHYEWYLFVFNSLLIFPNIETNFNNKFQVIIKSKNTNIYSNYL